MDNMIQTTSSFTLTVATVAYLQPKTFFNPEANRMGVWLACIINAAVLPIFHAFINNKICQYSKHGKFEQEKAKEWNTLSSYTKICTKHQSSTEKIKHKIAKLKEELNDQLKELKKKEDKIKELEEKQGELKEECDKKKSRRDECIEDIISKIKEIKEIKHRSVGKNKENLEKIKAENKERSEEIASSRANIEKVKREINIKNKEEFEIFEQLQELYLQQKLDPQDLSDEIQNKRKDHKKIESDIQEHKAKVKEEQRKVDELADEQKTRLQEQKRLRSNLERRTKPIQEKLHKRIIQLKNLIGEIEEIPIVELEKIEKIPIVELEKIEKTLKQKRILFENVIDELETQINAKTGSRHAIQIRINEITSDLAKEKDKKKTEKQRLGTSTQDKWSSYTDARKNSDCIEDELIRETFHFEEYCLLQEQKSIYEEDQRLIVEENEDEIFFLQKRKEQWLIDSLKLQREMCIYYKERGFIRSYDLSNLKIQCLTEKQLQYELLQKGVYITDEMMASLEREKEYEIKKINIEMKETEKKTFHIAFVQLKWILKSLQYDPSFYIERIDQSKLEEIIKNIEECKIQEVFDQLKSWRRRA